MNKKQHATNNENQLELFPRTDWDPLEAITYLMEQIDKDMYGTPWYIDQFSQLALSGLSDMFDKESHE